MRSSRYSKALSKQGKAEAEARQPALDATVPILFFPSFFAHDLRGPIQSGQLKISRLLVRATSDGALGWATMTGNAVISGKRSCQR